MKTKGFTPEELVELREKARRYSLKYATIKKRSLSEEFASYVVVEAVEGRYKKLGWMVTDFLRIEYGRFNDDGSVRKKHLGKLNPISTDNGRIREDKSQFNLSAFRSIPGLGDIMNVLPKTLSDKEHIVLVLFFKWGLTQKEIGEAMRFGESRTCQLISSGLKEVEKALRE